MGSTLTTTVMRGGPTNDCTEFIIGKPLLRYPCILLKWANPGLFFIFNFVISTSIRLIEKSVDGEFGIRT